MIDFFIREHQHRLPWDLDTSAPGIPQSINGPPPLSSMTAAVPEVKGRGAAAALAAAGALADTADGPQRQSHSGGAAAAAASEHSAPTDGQPAAAFYAVCTGIQQRVQAFLALQEATCSGVDQAALRRAQERTRRSLEVIGQALGRYK